MIYLLPASHFSCADLSISSAFFLSFTSNPIRSIKSQGVSLGGGGVLIFMRPFW
jgi:hypothetical protein